MKSVFITGANKGIGFETTRQLLKMGYYVYLGGRDQQKVLAAVEQLTAEGLTHTEAITIDVTDDSSVERACLEVSRKTNVLDVLINNAGIAGSLPQTALNLQVEQFKEVFETNLYGVVRTTNTFLSLLQKSTEPRILNVSSSIGSLTLHSDPNWPYYENANAFAVYSTSKAALNMYSVTLAYELRTSLVKVHMIDPGYIKTDFNNNQGHGSVKEAADRIISVLKNEELASGKFISEETNPATGECPW